MEFKPHDYQSYCVDFIISHPITALLLGCGLGKTVITLTALKELFFNLQISKVLIVAPLRPATDTWPAELKKWDHLKDLDISVVVGDKNARIAALNHRALLYVTNRENVKWLVEYYESRGLKWDFDCLVLDELSSFKNHQSQRFKYIRKIRPFVKRIIGLTGTPAANSLMDLWAPYALLDQGQRLGRFIGRYREAYFRPESMNPSTGIVYKYALRPGAEDMIYNRIRDITVSMKTSDYLSLPELVNVNQVVQMTDTEMKLYEMLKSNLIIPLADGDIDAANAAALSNKLLQMSSGAVYDEEGHVRNIHNHKLEALEDIIESATGNPVLVCYWYKHDRERIQQYFHDKGIECVDLKSSEDIRAWNAGEIPVGLLQPMSLGMGVNLQDGGHIIVWFSLTWSLEMYQQANARLWRQGQRETTTIYHLVTADTIDEDVLAALEKKDATQDRLIEAVKARLMG